MSSLKIKKINALSERENCPSCDIFKNDISQYQLKDIIGEGMFGKVKLGIHLLTNEKVALKIFDKSKISSNKEKMYIQREISILKKVKHYNIIKLYNIVQTEKHLFLVQEYASGHELLKYLESKENLSENEVCKFYQQIISGIEYLHEIGIAHRDLKLENILLTNKFNDIKIIDFGLSNIYDKESGELLHSSCGSPCYAAPEMIKGIEYEGVNTDIWSSGIILYLMLCKSFPFDDKNNSKLYQKILSGKFIMPNYLSNNAKDLLSKLLKVNPNERIKINEIKKHPWFNLVDPVKNYHKGIDINNTLLPIDDEIVKYMEKNFNITKNIIINYILKNNFNNVTTTYYLLLEKKIRKESESIADYKSDIYNRYINKNISKLSYYKNDIDLAIKNICNNCNEIKLQCLIPKIKNYHKIKNFLCNSLDLNKVRTLSKESSRGGTERNKVTKLLNVFSYRYKLIEEESSSYSKIKNKTYKLNCKNNKTPTTISTNRYKIKENKENNNFLKYTKRSSSIKYCVDKTKTNDLYLRLLKEKNYYNKNKMNYKYIPKTCKYSNHTNKSVDLKNKNNSILHKTQIDPIIEVIQKRKTIDNHINLGIQSTTNRSPKTIYYLYTKNLKNLLKSSPPKNKSQFDNSNNRTKKTSKNDYSNFSNNRFITTTFLGTSSNNIDDSKEITFKIFQSSKSPINFKENSKNNLKKNYFNIFEKREKNKKMNSLSQPKVNKKQKKSELSIDLSPGFYCINNYNNLNTNKVKRKNLLKFLNKNNKEKSNERNKNINQVHKKNNMKENGKIISSSKNNYNANLTQENKIKKISNI